MAYKQYTDEELKERKKLAWYKWSKKRTPAQIEEHRISAANSYHRRKLAKTSEQIEARKQYRKEYRNRPDVKIKQALSSKKWRALQKKGANE